MIENIVVILSAFDLLLTYIYVGSFKKMFPNKDYFLIEGNPIIKFCWKYAGFTHGSIISFIVILTMVFSITRILEYQWLYFAMGIFTMMIIFHMFNLSQLESIKGKVKK